MRFREFLIEYDRAKTAAMTGDKLITALIRDTSTELPSVLDKVKVKAGTYERGGPAAATMPEFTPEEKAKVIDDILAVIEQKDPTPNKAYTPWIARMYASGGLRKLEDINRTNLIGLYALAKKRKMLQPEHKDINNFKTYSDFEQTMVKKYDLDAIEAGPVKIDKGKSHKEYEDDDVVVIVPDDEAGSKFVGNFLGGPSKWCTSGDNDNRFDQYNRQGPLYILIPKHPEHKGEKYQLHFQTGEYQNELRDGISLVELLTKRFPNLFEFFKTKENTGLTNDIRFADPDIIQGILNQIREVGMSWVDEKVAEVEHDDYDYYSEMAERYPDEDGMVDWDAVHKAGDDYLNYNDYLRDKVNEFTDTLDTTVLHILKYVNDPDADEYSFTEIPRIMTEIALDDNYSIHKNTMFNEFFKDLAVRNYRDDRGFSVTV